MLDKVSGQKIRRQYFNIPIYLLLSVMAMMMSGWTVASMIDHTFATAEWFAALLPWLIFALPIFSALLILSVLNRFCFGEVVCVLNDKGLYYEDDGIQRIDWNDVKQVLYAPDLPGKIGARWLCSCNAAHITIKPFQKPLRSNWIMLLIFYWVK